MAIAPQQPHPSWYRHFWYAERSPRDTLLDRALLFGIVALGLVAGGMLLIRHSPAPHLKQESKTAETALFDVQHTGQHGDYFRS